MRDVANQSHTEFPGQGPVKRWTAPFLLIKISNEKMEVNVAERSGMSGLTSAPGNGHSAFLHMDPRNTINQYIYKRRVKIISLSKHSE